MDDIFTQVREGNAFQVRMWLDNTENDLNQGYVIISGLKNDMLMHLLNIFITFLDCPQAVFETSLKINNIRSVLKLKPRFLKVYSDHTAPPKHGFPFICKMTD